MGFRTLIPRAPLSTFVSVLWASDGDAVSHRAERVLPHGSAELVIPLGESAGPLLAGPRSCFTIVDTASQAAMVGAHIRPGGAAPLLSRPVGDLQNEMVSPDEVSPWDTGSLVHRLCLAGTPHERLRLLEEFLLSQTAWARPLHPAVTAALRCFRSRVGGQTGGRCLRRGGIFSKTARAFQPHDERDVQIVMPPPGGSP